MINDVRTVIWKEFKEIVNIRESRRATLLAMAVPAFILGILFPLQSGIKWVETPSLTTWFMVPFVLISSIIADSFAGERERHTLETLLSTRLSDKAILFGKIGAAICYGFGVTVLIALMGLLSVNIAYGKGKLLMISPYLALAGIMTGFFTASIAAQAGTLVSLRSATVRQAQQVLGFAMMVLFFSPAIIIQFVPKTYLLLLEEFLSGFESRVLIISVVVFFLLIDGFLFLWVINRFRRTRMILD